MDLFKFVLGLEKITFTETYEKPDAKKETKQESKIKDNKKQKIIVLLYFQQD